MLGAPSFLHRLSPAYTVRGLQCPVPSACLGCFTILDKRSVLTLLTSSHNNRSSIASAGGDMLGDCKRLPTANFTESNIAAFNAAEVKAAAAEKKLDSMRRSWENEKLALLESIEALKKLYTDTVINTMVRVCSF